ncbi:MAG: ATP-dependent Clp protease proteolytic subunit, partial [Clostridia bacterium]|nr:ATP-dependent Clp protease proteolytic subunit [Clostridia bacterium]
KIHADRIIKKREKLNQIMCECTGQPMDVMNEATDRDNFMSAQEALDFGLIDQIIEKR